LWLLEDNADASRNLKREAGARGVPPQRSSSRPGYLWRSILRDRDAQTVRRHLPLQCTHDGKRRTLGRAAAMTCTGQSFVSRVAAAFFTRRDCPNS
jgi:hypothetical protein